MQNVRDRRLLYAASFVRALAVGMSGVLLALHLAAQGFDARLAGALISLGLAGSAGWTLFATFLAERTGRRRFLVALSIAMIAGGVTLVLADDFVVLVAAFFLGAINGMGRDRGAGAALDQALLPSTVDDRSRTSAFAAYNVLQDVGHALGGLLAGLPALLTRGFELDARAAQDATLWLYPALLVVQGVMYARMSVAVEPRERAARPLSPRTRAVLWKISALFTLDSLAGGLLTTALLSYFFFERFGVGVGQLGLLFFGARLLNALSHFAAAWLARRIGLVNTMVFTHIPSSLLLASVAIAPSFEIAALLFLLREGLVEMDVPTRQSYVMAVVAPEDRIFASGVTHLVRMGAWAVGPAIAGLLMTKVSMSTPLLIGGAMKIAYDALLFVAFRNIAPPEER